MGTCVVTTASDVSDSNWRRKHMERAGFAKLRMWSVPNRKLVHFCGIFFTNLGVQILCIAAAQNVTDRSAFVTDKFIFCY